MKILASVLAAAMFLLPAAAFSESGSYSPRTGDRGFNRDLGDLNVEASVDVDAFFGRLSVAFNVSKDRLQELRVNARMEPADVYMTVKVAKVTAKPIEVVVREYEANRGKGWGVIAKRLGIKPGSREFHELKKGDDFMKKDKGKGKAKGKK